MFNNYPRLCLKTDYDAIFPSMSIKPYASQVKLMEYIKTSDTESWLHNESRMNAWAFPRKRWLDLPMTQQTELEAYPDYQVRLFRNNVDYKWRRELHEEFDGAAVSHSLDYDIAPVTINHFHDVFKDETRLAERKELYTRLATTAGVSIEGGRKVDS